MGPESGDGFPGEPPPEPLGDVDDVHTVLTGSVDGGQNKVLLSGCFEDRDGQAPLGNVYVEWLQDTEPGAGTAGGWVSQPGGCAGSPVGAPADDGAALFAVQGGGG